MTIVEDMGSKLAALRRERPLIHHITNFVTMDDCANATLAIGASPTMTNSVEEVAEMARPRKHWSSIWAPSSSGPWRP